MVFPGTPHIEELEKHGGEQFLEQWPESRAKPRFSGNGSISGASGTAIRDAIFDRVPPHDDAAEMAVLGGMLMSKDAIGEVSQMIDITDFYQPRNQTVYEAIINLFSASQPVDAVLVANQLLKDGDLEKVGGSDYLHSLVASVPTAANATFYADIIHQRAILRNVIAAGTKIAQLGYTAEGSQAEDVVNLAQAEVYEMSTGKVRQDYARSAPSSPIPSTKSTDCKTARFPKACQPDSVTSTT